MAGSLLQALHTSALLVLPNETEHVNDATVEVYRMQLHAELAGIHGVRQSICV